MMHPDTFVKKSRIGGKGVFARKFIPRGTVLWRLSAADVRVYTMAQYRNFSRRYKAVLRKFTEEDANGNLIYDKDYTARHMNHSCDPNMADINDISIAVKDIRAGEEITYDYGPAEPRFLRPMRCRCAHVNCRKLIYRLPSNSKIITKLLRSAGAASKYLLISHQPLVKRSELAAIRSRIRETLTSKNL